MTEDELLKLDREHVWHPYASMPNAVPTYAVKSAEGVTLTLKNGDKLIDGMASWWSAIHGYNHPKLNQAIKQQVNEMSHVMFGGLTHEPAVQLCKTLVDISPSGLNKVFLADSGSVSVEVAIKMALQYWLSQGEKNKTRLLSLRNGYHGDTFGAMATCDPVTGMHHLFSDLMPKHFFAEQPSCRFEDNWDGKSLDNIHNLIKQNHQQIAAVILEPIVQGTGGMRFYSPEYLKQVHSLCKEFNVLLITDEIATGFGRSGKLFACEHADITPDILCLGKSLTGGTMTLAATLCTDKVAAAINEGEAGVLMHGPTFMGNPLACAAANTNIDILLNDYYPEKKNGWQLRIQEIESQLKQCLSPAKEIPGVADVRVLGAIGAVELNEPVDMKIIQPMFVEHGIWLRPFGKLVYMMPPYITNTEELETLCRQTLRVIQAYLSQ